MKIEMCVRKLHEKKSISLAINERRIARELNAKKNLFIGQQLCQLKLNCEYTSKRDWKLLSLWYTILNLRLKETELALSNISLIHRLILICISNVNNKQKGISKKKILFTSALFVR